MKINVLLIALLISSCATTPKGNYAITTFDSDGEIKQEYFVNSYEQSSQGLIIKVNGKPVEINGSFQVEKIKQ